MIRVERKIAWAFIMTSRAGFASSGRVVVTHASGPDRLRHPQVWVGGFDRFLLGIHMCIYQGSRSNRSVSNPTASSFPLSSNGISVWPMVLCPVSNRDWTDPAWNISTPDPEENILTALRLKNERGRGCHKVEDPALQQFFVSTTMNIISRLSESESAKIDFNNISSSLELKGVYVTINQCTVRSSACLYAVLCE